jgi:SagB-type dehydrogenase family enzyme
MARGEVARAYHRLTSARLVNDSRAPAGDPRVVRGFQTDVPETFPAPCKQYPDELPTVPLPRRWARGAASATSVLAGRCMQPIAALDLPRLGRVLQLSAGIVRLAERSDGRKYMFRASGSAGGRFPLELYLAARGVDGLPDDVYWFDPLRHALVRVAPPPRGEASTLVITGVPWRTAWRYAERGYRHLYWDSGAMLAHILAVAEAGGLCPTLRTVFPDGAVAALVGADGVQEFPLATVTFGVGEPAVSPSGPAVTGDVDRLAPIEFPLITQAQHAGDGERLGAPRPAGAPLSGPVPASDVLDEVILRRISTRVMDPLRSVTRALFEWTMAVSLRGCPIPHFVAVHAVESLEPGLYRWPSLGEPLRRGELRQELYHVCWDQELGRDAAFVVIAAVDLARLDDRGYREAQLEAGLVDGRLHLAAYALGVGASGMAFLDAAIAPLLGEPLAGLLLTCVGVPAYRHRPGGPPGAPVRMRPLKISTP